MMGTVHFEKRDRVAVVTLSNPRIKNALTIDMARELGDICREIENDRSLGCAVIRGDAGTFCSGADTASWSDTYGADALSDQAYEETDLMYGSFVQFGGLSVPTIAALRGAAVGAGLNLAMAADLRVVSDSARLIAGFMAAGIHPGGGFFMLARRLGGREISGALGLFGQEVSGQRAYDLGFAGVCVSDDQVEQRTLDIAEGVARDPLLARRVKRSFEIETGSQFLSWPTALEAERGVQLWTQRRRLNAGKGPS